MRSRMRRRQVLSIVIGVAAAACGGGGGGNDGPPVDQCDDPLIYSRFIARPSQANPGRSGGQVRGWVRDAPSPEIVGVIAEAGGCRFFGAQPALCTPACDGSDVCDISGECRSYPDRVDAGTVTVTGTTPPLTMMSSSEHAYSIDDEHPGLFGAGDPITLHVAGTGAIEPFEITTLGVPELVLPTDQLTAREHEDMIVGWTPITGAPGAEVVLELYNDHHAGPEAIECRADPAAGVLTVPAAILDRLILAGESGTCRCIEFSWIEVRQRRYASTSRGCAAFDAESDRQLTVTTIRAP
jgi:hypothetical protein